MKRIPKGFRFRAQGCEERATLGIVSENHQPQRGCVATTRWAQPRWDCLCRAIRHLKLKIDNLLLRSGDFGSVLFWIGCRRPVLVAAALSFFLSFVDSLSAVELQPPGPQPGQAPPTPELQRVLETLARQRDLEAATALAQQQFGVRGAPPPATTTASPTSSAFPATTNVEWANILDLADGGSLHGQLKEMGTNQLVWVHPAARDPILFQTRSVGGIRFAKPEAVVPAMEPTGWFQFRNGDEVWGDLQSLDGRTAGIDTWFGGRIQAPRNSLRSITFSWLGFRMQYQGPHGADGWRFGSAWTYEDGAFIAKGVGALGRSMGLAGSSSVAFELGWSQNFALTLQCFTTSLDRLDSRQHSYLFLVTPGLVRVQRFQQDAGLVTLGDALIPAMMAKRRIPLEVRFNPERATVQLLFEGKPVKEWHDSIPFTPRGDGLVFQSQSDTPISISNIKVTLGNAASSWVGQFGKLASDPEPVRLAPDQVSVFLANRDELKGRAPEVSNAVFKVSFLDMPIEFPLRRISQLVFPSEADPIRLTTSKQVQAQMAGGGAISFELERWGENAMAGRSEIFGKVELNPRSIQQLRFEPDRDAERGAVLKPAEDEFSHLDYALDEFGGAPLAEAEARALPDYLLLKNGDRLRGALESIRPGQSFLWQSPRIAGSIDFAPDAVRSVELGKPAGPIIPASGQSRVWLTTGEMLEGNLTRWTPDQLTLDTWYGGELTIPRARVQRLHSKLALAPPSFEGPVGLERWTMGLVSSVPNSGLWSYRDGAFYARKAASIGRNVGLPDVARIEWDLRWSDTLYIAVALYADQLQPIDLLNKDSAAPFGGFYSLQIHNAAGLVKLLAVTRENSTPDLGQASVLSLVRTNAAHFEVLVNKPRQTIAIAIDGNFVKEWKETNGFIGLGTGMRFVHQGQGAVKLTGFRVSPWDGQYEEKPVLTPQSKEDRLKLFDGREFLGEMQTVGEGVLRFRADDGKLIEVPMPQVKIVEIGGEKLDWSKPDEINVRATFWNGRSIGLALEEWRGDQLKARSPSFDTATFRRAAFKRIEFF